MKMKGLTATMKLFTDFTIISLLPSLLMVLALTVDAFAASIAYGAEGIHIPTRSAFVLAVVCTGLLVISVAAGQWLSPLFPPASARFVGSALLIIIGVIKLFDAAFKQLLKKLQGNARKISFKFFSIHFILKIFADCKAADRDSSRLLTIGEAAALATALSIDGLASGFGAGLASISLPITTLLSLLLTLLAVKGGSWLGKKASVLPFNLTYAGGAILILLGSLRLV